VVGSSETEATTAWHKGSPGRPTGPSTEGTYLASVLDEGSPAGGAPPFISNRRHRPPFLDGGQGGRKAGQPAGIRRDAGTVPTEPLPVRPPRNPARHCCEGGRAVLIPAHAGKAGGGRQWPARFGPGGSDEGYPLHARPRPAYPAGRVPGRGRRPGDSPCSPSGHRCPAGWYDLRRRRGMPPPVGTATASRNSQRTGIHRPAPASAKAARPTAQGPRVCRPTGNALFDFNRRLNRPEDRAVRNTRPTWRGRGSPRFRSRMGEPRQAIPRRLPPRPAVAA